tara:strand:+ start:243 stop:353 length:111 start_codon:yes stop_codon:yes gene_type:complete
MCTGCTLAGDISDATARSNLAESADAIGRPGTNRLP